MRKPKTRVDEDLGPTNLEIIEERLAPFKAKDVPGLEEITMAIRGLILYCESLDAGLGECLGDR